MINAIRHSLTPSPQKNRRASQLAQRASTLIANPLQCRHCHEIMTKSQLAEHHSNGCPEQKMICTQCEGTFKRKEFAIHMANCPQKWLMKPGNMSRKQRELVSKSLRKCEHSHLKLTVVDIRNELKKNGMKSIVIEGDAAFTWSSGSDNIYYSKWCVQCGEDRDIHNYVFTVVCFAQSKAGAFTCVEQGNMKQDQIECIAEAMKECITTNNVATNVIKDKLKEKGMRTIVFQNDNGFSLSKKGAEITWSVWKSQTYGKFGIVSTQWRPVDNSKILCKNPGNMSVNEKHVILLALRHCDEKNKMGVSHIRNKLNELGMKSIVIKDKDAFCYLSGAEPLTWSDWECTKYGLFTIIKTEFRSKDNENIKCVDHGNSTDIDRYTIMEVLDHCLKHQNMQPEDIHRQLKARNIDSIVMKNATEGFAQQGGSEHVQWSKWDVTDVGSFTIMITK